MSRKVIGITPGITATITVKDSSDPTKWSVIITGYYNNRHVHINLTGEEIFRFLWSLDPYCKKVLEEYVPKEYFDLAEKAKKDQWEAYEDRGGGIPLREGLTVLLDTSHRPPFVRFYGTLPGRFFEMRITGLVEIIKVALELMRS